jgi:serine/threonine protein kinase
MQQGMEEFCNEILLVASMRHKNLVKFKGCCFGDYEQWILVYEFVENNNLVEVIFGNITLSYHWSLGEWIQLKMIVKQIVPHFLEINFIKKI